MSDYLHVFAEDLQIGDSVRGRGRLSGNVEDHPTLEGFVTAIFEKGGEELPLVVLGAKQVMKVRYVEED